MAVVVCSGNGPDHHLFYVDVALMFLTGRDNEVDKILGLEIGADDDITKPFNPRELTIRARTMRQVSPCQTRMYGCWRTAQISSSLR